MMAPVLASFNFADFARMLADHWWSEFRDLGDWPWGTLESIAEYIDLFPIVVCLVWSIYGLNCLFGSFRRRTLPAVLPGYSVLIPFYAEPLGALRSAQSLSGVHPPPNEILLIDDGSPETTEDILDEASLPPRTRVLRMPKNGGKAAALNAGLREAESDIVVCLDADTVVRSQDWREMLARFASAPGVGAVTGKIWPAEARTLPQLLQALDYLAVIGLVKNAEDRWGGIMTVSGAWVAFRRAALVGIGAWNEKTAAEDIDLSWRLQSAGWRIVYERSWIALVEMVPTWSALWRQRRRWSRGLGRAVREHFGGVLQQRATHLPVALITLLGAGWLWASLLTGVVRAASVATRLGRGEAVANSAIWSRAFVYVGICFAFFLLQMLIATLLDRSRWWLYPKLFVLAPLYTIYFWGISLTTFVVGFPQGFFKRDRGQWRRTMRNSELATGAPAEFI
ncbi:MAG: glycosyltransferase [Verrucomicrobiota bacterium]|nr:glycosyltransferase [Verrucomicrobiota bacterium]